MRVIAGILFALIVGRCARSQIPNHPSLAPDFVSALEVVSEKFNVPVGLEYRVSRVTTQTVRVPVKATTAGEALTGLVKQIPGLRWRFEGGVAHVFEQTIVGDKRNLLNVLLKEDFSRPSSTVETSSLLMQAAEEIVRPRPGGGRGGSFPQGVGELQIALKTRHGRLRQYLNELVRVSRARMWVVTFSETSGPTEGGFFEVAPAAKRLNGPGLPPMWTLLRWTRPVS
jgi:hypothetical protein